MRTPGTALEEACVERGRTRLEVPTRAPTCCRGVSPILTTVPHQRGFRVRRLTYLVLICSALASCADKERIGLATPAALASIMAGSRPVEPMLTAFSQQPCVSSDEFGQGRGAGSQCAPFPRPGSDRFTTLSRLANRLAEASDEPAAPAMLHTRGLWHLLWQPSSETLDRSIGALRSAMAWSPSSADIRSDLAAAYYLRNGVAADPRDLLAAIEYAEQALYIERSHRPAAFNRDLALVALGLFSRQEIEHDPLASRRLLDLHLLPAWGRSCDSSLRGWPDRETRDLRRLADELTTITGDTLPMATVEAIEAARRSLDLTRLRELCQGHVLYAEAVQAYEAGLLEKARSTFRRSGAALAAAQSPFAIWPTFYEAVHVYYDQDFSAAERQLEEVREEATRRRYLHLDARSSWVLGVIEINRGNRQSAIDSYRRAAALLERTGELGSRAYVAALLAEALDSVGQVRAGWQERLLSLKGLDHLESARQRHNVLFLALEAVERESLPHAALYFGEELLRRAEASGDPLLRAEAHRLRAQTLARVDQHTLAFAHLARAVSLAQKIEPQALSERVLADVLLTRGRVELASDPSAAANSFSMVLRLHGSQDRAFHLPELFLARARALIEDDRLEEAEVELWSGVDLFDRDLVGAETVSERRALAKSHRSLLLELIGLDLTRGRFAAAVEHLEQMHSRMSSGTEEPSSTVRLLSVQEIAVRLPDDVILVYLAALEGDIWIWKLADQRIHPVLRMRNRAAEVDRLTRQLLDADHSPRRAAARLFETLVRPWFTSISPDAKLVMVTDEVLSGVPFGALLEPHSSTFLFQKHVIVHALSANSFIRNIERSPSRARPSLFAVAAGSGDYLPRVGAEVRDIGSFYPNARVESALRSAANLFQISGRYSVLHLGVHTALVGRERVLVLGNDQGSEVPVATAEAIAEMDLQGIRIVVLAACAAAGGRTSSGTGADNLVWPFLTAGVPAVIAPVTEVKESETVELMRELHSHLSRSVPASDALQRSQIELLSHTATPQRMFPSWVFFQVYGS